MNFSVRARVIAVAAMVLAALSLAPSLAAVEVPPLAGRVSDHAGMISPSSRDALEKKLAELEKTDSTQVAVVTVPDLQGVTVEEFSMAVAEKWKIGQKKLDNGVIFLVSKAERKMRIEVGYGLEGRLTDLLAGRILDNEVRPAFRAGDFDGGFARGVDGIILAVRGEYHAAPAQGSHDSDSGGVTTFFLVFLIIIMSIGARGIVRGTVAGGVIFPAIMFATMSMALTAGTVVALVVVGLIIGFILSLIARAMSLGGGSGGWGGGSSGWSSGGGGGFSGGGFSGGGGSFGGGGASSGW